LQVEERHVTAIEQPSLREVALGPQGPDTTTRVQTVWQVHLRQTAGGLDCVSAQDLLPQPSRGRLTTDVEEPAPVTDPCQPGGGGGYCGLENQLYRVEIHGGGDLGTATFKWSRENGSVVVAVDDFVEEPAGTWSKVVVGTLGRDDVLGLAETQWVELVDDVTVQLGQPGTMAQILDVKPAVGGGYVVELSVDVAGHVPPGTDPAVWHPRLRRWDQSADLQPDGTLLTAAGPIELELGVQVAFTVDAAGSGPEFRTGEYWISAARTGTGEIEILDAAPPRGARHYALLALVAWDSTTETLTVHDCRPIFPPATDMIHLLYVGGDGQQGPAGAELPAPLQVSVTRGRFPVPGAHVRFAVVLGSGTITPAAQAFDVDGNPIADTAATDAEGVAACTWTLGSEAAQRVEARLLLPDGADAPNPPVRFSAALALEAGADPGVRIKGIFWNEAVGGPPIPAVNDRTVPMHRFLTGLNVDCEDKIAPASVRRPTCFVTLDLPFPMDHPVWGGGLKAYERVILDASVGAVDNVIGWRPTEQAKAWLDSLVHKVMREHDLRLLAHLILKGNFIWQVDRPDVYLDGEALGTPDGAELHNLRLPSGNRRSGGDFEMWFWVEPDSEVPQPEGEIVWDMVGIDNVVSLDPVRANDTYDKAIIDLLYAGLVRLNEKMEVVPDLADSWEFSPEGDAITFFLRHDQAFSDGSPLTAEDYKFSLERARDPNNGRSGPIYLSAIAQIDVIDDSTLRLTADGVFPRFFLFQLTTPPAKIVSRAAVKANPEAWDENPVTSGAFWVPQWQRGTDKLALERNAKYWQTPGIARLSLQLLADRGVAWNRYLAGESHVLSSLQSDAAHEAPPEIRDQLVPPISPPFGLRYLGFDHRKDGPLADRRVRQALAFALDRKAIVEAAFGGTVPRAARLAPPGLVRSLGFKCDFQDPLPFDSPKAAALMEEAGFQRTPDGSWLSPAGAPFQLRLAFAGEGNNEQVVQIIAQFWQQFGVSVDLEGFDPRGFSEHLHAMHEHPGMVQAYYSLWVTDYADPQHVLSQQFHTVLDDRHENNNGHYSSEEFDAIVDMADARSPVGPMLPTYCKAELAALGDVAVLPLFYPEARALIREGVAGLVVAGQGIVIPDFGALNNP
jgi:ABC-type transport system substrate-binding protein